MREPAQRSRKRDPLPVVTISRARCPECRSVNVVARSSRDQGDGSKLRYAACRECGKHFVLIVE
jgi:transposase-like protein